MSDEARAQLRARLAKLAGVVEATSRFGTGERLAWRAGSREIAHLHSAEVIDIRVPATLQRQWRGDIRLMPRARRSDWIECRVRSPADVEFAAVLVEIAARAAQRSTPTARS